MNKQQEVFDILQKQLAKGDTKLLIDGGDDKNFTASLTDFQLNRVKDQAQHIYQALYLRLSQSERSWSDSCELAASMLLHRFSLYTIKLWYRLYISSGFKFPVCEKGTKKAVKNMNPFLVDGKTNMRDNNDLYQIFCTFVLNNLEGLTVEIVRKKLHEILLPIVTETPEVLATYRIQLPLSPYTTSRWMEEMRMLYSKEKKSYMIDTHERKDVLLDCIEYLKNFFVQELCEPCWITFQKSEFLHMMQAYDIDSGKVEVLLEGAYESEDGTLEFHVDQNECFADLVSDLPLPGEKSIRAPPESKTVIVLGQDESVFVPHLLKNHYWTFEDITPCRTKTEGAGVMISLLISREFGIGFG